MHDACAAQITVLIAPQVIAIAHDQLPMLNRYVDMDGASEAPLVTGHTQPVTCLALPTSEAAPLMATTCLDGLLRIWQMPSQPSNWHKVRLHT